MKNGVYLLRIEAPHFVAAVDLDEDLTVVYYAPILKYMRGWSVEKIVEYCKEKGWTVERVNE